MCAHRIFPILPRCPVEGHTGRMPDIPRRPGDRILDRYCPHLTSDERKVAHECLGELARVLIRIHRRLASQDIPTLDSTHSDRKDKIPSLPQA